MSVWIALALVLFSFYSLCCLNACSPRRPATVAVSNNGDSNNDNPRDQSPEPQTPQREWLSSDDEKQLEADSEEQLHADLGRYTTKSADPPMPQTPPHTDSESEDGGSDSQGDHLQTTNRSVNNPVRRTPCTGYGSNDQGILFFKLDTFITNSSEELSKLVPSSPGEPVDLDSGTMLITSLKDKDNSSLKVQFRISPLRGEQDVILVYTAEGVLAARIPKTRLKELRACIEDTITRLLTLADSIVPIPKTISWLQTPIGLAPPPPIRVCFIMTNNDGAVIRGSRIPNGIPRNTYSVFSGRFCSVRHAFNAYFGLKGHDGSNLGLKHTEFGDLEAETHKLNGQRELLITCPRLGERLEGGIFVRDEDGNGWNEEVTLEKVVIPLIEQLSPSRYWR